MENHISTTIEQSKHLLSLGLDPKSADMVWMFNKWLYSIKDNILNKEQFSERDTLAWSLSALLEVMPITITKDGMEYKLGVFPSGLFSTHCDTSKWTLQYCGRDYSYKSRDKYPILAAITQHDIITAAYEMVCWLLEQGIIKKGANDE
jgi:hypothetical protein